MAMTENSSGFCLFCYKNTEIHLDGPDGLVESVKKLAKVINGSTNDQNVRIDEDQLLTGFSENYKLINYCSNCDTIITQLCEIDNQIKRLELQLGFKLDNLVEKISFANQVPSRWVHMTKALEEHFQDDTENTTAASQNVIREFRQNILKAAQHRKQNSQPNLHSEKIHLKRQHGHGKEMDSKSKRNIRRRKPNKQILEDDSDKLVKSTRISNSNSDDNQDNHLSSSDDNFEEEMPINEDAEFIEELEHNAAFALVKVERAATVDDIDEDEYLMEENFNTMEIRSTEENESEEYITVCCEFCKKPFPGMTQLTQHINEDKCSANNADQPNSTRNKICPKCGKQLKTNFYLKVHLEWHKSPDEWKFKCQVCGKKFHSKNNLRRHLKGHEKDSSKRLELSQAMETGNSRNQSENITNDFANNDATPSSEHDAIIIKDEPTILFPNFEESDTMDDDDNCDTEHWWDNASTVSSTLQISDKVVPPFIEEPKRRPPPLPRPSTSASSSKLAYECEICPSKFKRLMHKECHFKFNHDLEGKPEATPTYKCEIGDCKAYFLTYNQLRKHYNLDHQSSLPLLSSDEAERKAGRHRRRLPPPKQITLSFKCEICSRQFKVRGQKDYHVKACHGLPGSSEATEVFKCEMGDCTAYFLKKHQLNKHYDVEHKVSAQKAEPKDETNMGHKCKKCGKGFVGWARLREHLNKFKSKSCAIFECKFCGEKFSYRIGLSQHLSLRHKNEMEGKYRVRGNKNLEEDHKKVDNVEEIDTSVDGKGDTDNVPTNEVNLEEEKIMDFEPNVFGRKGECLESGSLVEIEELD